MSRILIDGRFIGVGESMTRYVLEILKVILATDKENEYTLLVRPIGLEVAKKWLGNAFHASSFKIQVLDVPHYSPREQTDLLRYLVKGKYDLVHFIQFNHPVLYKRPFVITVHDLTMVGYLHYENVIKRVAFTKVMKSAIKDSKKIITISKNSKAEILDYCKVNPDKIKVVYNGIDHERYNLRIKNQESRIKQFKEKYGIVGDYLLYTGMWKKHKNLVRLLKAFEIYLKTQNSKLKTKETDLLQLVLVGKRDESEPEVIKEIDRINYSLAVDSGQAVKEPNSQLQAANCKPIITTGFIEEEELPISYAGALAYVIPSLNEGFGIPPLEAMACGVPVISSNASCMPEVLGGAANYFDPYDVSDIAKAIGEIVGDEKLRQELIKKGLGQAKKYSWEESAKGTLEVYKEVLK